MQRRRPGPTVSRARPSGLPRPTTAAVWALWVVSVAFVVASLITARAGGPDDPLPAVVIGVAVLSFATVGAILVSRLPANVIGWLLALGGLCLAVGNGAGGLADLGLNVHPGSVPGAIWFAWLTEWIWAPAIGAVVGLALVYPSGRLLSARWRPVALAAVLIIALVSFGSATGPWPAGIFPVANPLLITGAIATILNDIGVVAGPIALLVALLAVASLVLRYRRAAGIERAQLKWFAFVTAISVPAFLATTVLYGNSGVPFIALDVAGLVAFGGFALLPVAIGLAVLRYRLYEIDQLISRTIAYGLLTAIVAGVFVAAILVFQALLAPLTQSNELAVAGATLLVFSLFQPIRRRLQRLVDRRFNRTRYDAAQTVATLATRLRDEVDLDAVRADILAAVDAALQPSTLSLWLRG